MLLGDYINAVMFKANGIPHALDWADEDSGTIAELRRRRKQASIGIIG
jgi:hypothetical protein